MLMAPILLLGFIGYEPLPVAALPNIDTPTVLVTAQFPGADAQTVASTVTTPLERQFGQISGLTQMTSSSGNESSEIYIAIRSQNQRQFCFAGGAGGHQCGG
jgi:multidrug efflux pump subunit AcrB